MESVSFRDFELEIESLFYILNDVGINVYFTENKTAARQLRGGDVRFGIKLNRSDVNLVLSSSKKSKEFIESYVEFIDRVKEVCSNFGYNLIENSAFVMLGGVHIYSDFKIVTISKM